ncbi:MAG: 6,7-dimethyl-8-ribityllumazine synthase [Gammaproteobacteria bacterium]|nr:6,7-dimethyl-8-ribityllumazine synthase [Gammaproteobacteria bacterium]
MSGTRAGSAEISARDMRIAVVAARFNQAVVDGLLGGVERTLQEHGGKVLECHWVPGAWELPVATQWVARHTQPDAIIALGAVIRGDTAHFEYISGECATGLSRVALDHNVSVAFGVLTCDTQRQADVRSADDEHNKGAEAALAALEMVALARELET